MKKTISILIFGLVAQIATAQMRPVYSDGTNLFTAAGVPVGQTNNLGTAGGASYWSYTNVGVTNIYALVPVGVGTNRASGQFHVAVNGTNFMVLGLGGSNFFYAPTYIGTASMERATVHFLDSITMTATLTQVGISATWHQVSMSDDGRVMAAVSIDEDGVYVSTNYGVSWNEKGTETDLYSVAVSPNGYAIGVAGNGTRNLFVSHDIGETWYDTSLEGAPITGISFGMDNSKILATEHLGQWDRSYDGGTNWDVLDGAMFAYTWTSVANSDDFDKMFAVRAKTDMRYSWDAGTNILVPTGGQGHHLTCSDDGLRVYIADATPGLIYTSGNTGETYVACTGITNQPWADIECSSDGMKVLACVNPGYLYYSRNYGTSWIRFGGSNAWSSVDLSDDGRTAIASISGGYLYLLQLEEVIHLTGDLIPTGDGYNLGSPDYPINELYLYGNPTGVNARLIEFDSDLLTLSNSLVNIIGSKTQLVNGAATATLGTPTEDKFRLADSGDEGWVDIAFGNYSGIGLYGGNLGQGWWLRNISPTAFAITNVSGEYSYLFGAGGNVATNGGEGSSSSFTPITLTQSSTNLTLTTNTAYQMVVLNTNTLLSFDASFPTTQIHYVNLNMYSGLFSVNVDTGVISSTSWTAITLSTSSWNSLIFHKPYGSPIWSVR